MTTISWWNDIYSDDRIVDVGGFARVTFSPWRFMDEAIRRFPILSPMPSLAGERYEEVWWQENIAPLLALSMPVHDNPPTGETPERREDG